MKWFDGSKVVDENGEPRVMWHGGAKDVHKFRPSGDTTGSGYYTDPRNGNKVPVDSVRAMFFSTDMSVGLSYATLTGINYYQYLYDKLRDIVFNSSEDEISATHDHFKTVDEIVETIEKSAEFDPRLKKAADYIRSVRSQGKKLNDNKKAVSKLFHILQNVLRRTHDNMNNIDLAMSASSAIRSALQAISFVDEYNTPSGRIRLLSGEIPTWIKKEWSVYKQKELNRNKAGKSPIANYETLVFYSDRTLHKNVGYDGVGIFVGEGSYITDLSNS